MDIESTFSSLSAEVMAEYETRRQEENLHLDFKLVQDAAFTKRDDRRNLACACSGFANSSGGLIVWGVDARKNHGINYRLF
jgi:predicted HTH transcriptional regulator